MTCDLRLVSGAVMLLLAPAVPQAAAVEILHTPDAIRVCLCLDQAVTSRSAELNQESDKYDGEEKALAELKTQAETTRQHLDAANMAQRDTLARMLEQRDAAARRFATETTPHYNAIVDLYNEAAGAFNRACGDKAYDWSVLPQVQSALSCPSPADSTK